MAAADRDAIDPRLIDLALIRTNGSAEEAILGALRSDKGTGIHHLSELTGYSVNHCRTATRQLVTEGRISQGYAKINGRNAAVYWRPDGPGPHNARADAR